MRITLLFLTLLAFTQAKSQTFQSFAAQATEAYKAGDYPKFYSMIMEAHKLHPYHQIILFHAGSAAALNNKPEEAIDFLTRAIQIRSDFDLSDADFKSLEGREDFKKLKELQADIKKTIVNSDTAFVVKDKTLHVESIAAGESKGIFYLGSIHKRKIVRTDEKGKFSDFTTSGQDGLASVFGIKVDASKKVLWACASPLPEMENFDTLATSGVYKYDLKSKKLLAKFTPEKKGKYVFGDLTLDPTGKAFISDTWSNTVYYANEKTGKLEDFFHSDDFWNLQGITFSTDGKYLFIADYIKGIFRLDLKDKTLKQLPQKFSASLKSVDGLTYYDHSLVAIQNQISPMRVTLFKLNDAQDELTGFEIIDRGHPAFNEPTIGCRVNDTFYYVANSLWSGYTRQHTLKPVEELEDVVILKADLKKLK